MIRLQRKRTDIPAKYRGPKLQALLLKLLEGYYEFNGDVPFNQQKTRFQQWAQAKPSLIAESHGKCAYCESDTSITAYGDVEHFRPKDLYWWLAFSFDNYTYSCQLCNQKFKGANFPVNGKRIKPLAKLPKARPADAKLAALATQLCPDPAADNDTALNKYFKPESAYLPHPYLGDPEELFAWEADDINREIRLLGKGSGAAAKRAMTAAVDYLGLNREELQRVRYVHYASIHQYCLVLQESTQPKVRQLCMDALKLAADSSRPYAGMTRYFLRQWGVLAG